MSDETIKSTKIERQILIYLNSMVNGGAVQASKIGKEIEERLTVKEIEPHLERLKKYGYVQSKLVKIPALKSFGKTIPASSYQTYFISQKGIVYINNGFINNLNSLDKLCEITEDIEYNTAETAKNTFKTNEVLFNIQNILDSVLNSMGAQHQQSLKLQIKNNHLLEEYIELMESKDNDKESKIQKLFKNISGELAVTLLGEYLKKKIGL